MLREKRKERLVVQLATFAFLLPSTSLPPPHEMADSPLHNSAVPLPHTPRDSLSSESTDTNPLHIRREEYEEDDDALADADALLASENGEKPPQRDRAGSFSFGYSPHLLQLAASSDERREDVSGGAANGRVKEHVSLAHGVALVVGTIVGSGIFSSPGIVAKESGSVGSALFIWIGAGLLSWAGTSLLLLYWRVNRKLSALSSSRRVEFCGIGKYATYKRRSASRK